MATQDTTHSDDLLDTKAVGAIIGKHPTTLAQWRIVGDGPDYIKIGASVRYRRSVLEAWLDANTVRQTGPVEA